MSNRSTCNDHCRHLIFWLVLVLLFSSSISVQARAAVLSPGDISACGELAAPGTYSLTTDVATTSGAACFTITSDSVVLTSSTTGSYTITGDIDGNGVNAGDPGFDFTVEDLTVIGTTSANGASFGSGTTTTATTTAGNAGDITVSTSTMGAIEANGGADNNMGTTSYSGVGGTIIVASSTTLYISANGGSGAGYGGNGGSISVAGTAVDIASSSISAAGGMGSTTDGGNGANGSLAVNYSSLIYSGAQLSVLSDLVLNGPGGSPGDLGPFAGGALGTLPGATITDTYQCNLALGGTYYLGANLSGDCLIEMDGVVLTSSTTGSYTINGDVIGDGLNAGNPGNNFTLEDLTVTGTTSSNGVDSSVGAGGAGGSITISSSTLATTTANGGEGLAIGIGGSGGTITMTSSISTLAQALGGVHGDYFNSANGSTAYNSSGGVGGLISLASSTVTSVQADGGNTGSVGGNGGSGGSIHATSSIVTSTRSNGGMAQNGSLGGMGGVISLAYSTSTSLSVNGGFGAVLGGEGGTIDLTGADLNISAMTISVAAGGQRSILPPSPPGDIVLNYSTLIRTGVNLPAASDLILNGPGGMPGDTGAFVGGILGTIPGDILTNISQCPLTISGPYYLGADLVGNCRIEANDVTLNGMGLYAIQGSVIGDGLTAGNTGINGAGDAGYDFTLENMTVVGTTTSNGHDGLKNGGNGGSITVLDSTVSTTTSNGGNAGGAVFSVKQGGNGGSISVEESTSTLIQANGGLGYYNGNNIYAMGGNGGIVVIATSTTGAVMVSGGDSPATSGGNGGTINITHSIANPIDSTVSANGGSALSGTTACVYGGNGGVINIASSTYGAITANPGVTNQSVCAQNPGITQLIGGQSGSTGQVQVAGQYVSPASLSIPEEGAPSSPSPSPETIPSVEATPNAGSSFGGSGTAVGVISPAVIPLKSASTTPIQGAINTFVHAISSAGMAVGAAAKAVTQTAGMAAETPVSKAVETTGFLTGLLAVAALYANTGLAAASTGASGILLIPIKLWGLITVGLGIRKRGRPWGTVYDSVTKQPLDPAFVTAKDQNGKVVAESITDLDGRYGFLLPPGEYYLSARKTNYEFPSKKMSGKLSDELYSDLYFGAPVAVAAEDVIDKNIPMDREDFDWNEEAKKDQGLMSFHTSHEKLWARIGRYVYGVGLVISAVAALAKPTFYNVGILAAYVLLFFFLRSSFKKKRLGRIVDGSTHAPLSYAIIHVTAFDHQTVLKTAVCDALGRYYCIVPKGQYYVDIDRKLPDGGYARAYSSELIYSNSGVLNEDFKA